MDFSLSYKTKVILILAAAGAILAGLVWLNIAQAIIVSAPGAPRLEGDTTTLEILDKTITDLDVSERAEIAGTKVGLGAGDLIPFSQGTRLATSTLFNFATSTGNRFGVATTTPGENLAVGGGALIAGELRASSIQATSSITLGKVTYTPPATDGSNLTYLQTNGAGGLTWATAGFSADKVYATTTSGGAMTSTTWKKVPLNVEVYDPNSRFDNATNYRFTGAANGYFLVTALVYCGADSGSTECAAAIRVNNKERCVDERVFPSTGGVPRNSISCQIYLNSGDYLELWARQVGTGSLTLCNATTGYACELWVQWLY